MVAEYEYDAWGNYAILTNVNNIANINTFRYRGYYQDNETGFYYLQTRYYDPAVRRFTSPDNYGLLPNLAESGDLNFYTYCKNNPVMYIDSTGKYPLQVIPNFLVTFEKDLPLANVVNRFSYTESLKINPLFARLIGNLSFTVTVQSEKQGWFYAYTDIGNGYVGYGAGINLGNVLGIEVGVTGGSFWDFGVHVGISFGYFSIGKSIGTSGIGTSLSLTIENTTYTVEGTIGWGTIAFATAMALSPIPGGRLIAACSLLIDWLF